MKRVQLCILAMLTIGIATRANAQAARTQRLVRELRLDANEEDFPTVNWFTVGPAGQIAVPIADDQQIRLYDAQGHERGAVGRVGSGPSEFRKLSWMGWNGDTLWAYDDALRRLTFVNPEGKFSRSVLLGPRANEGGTSPVDSGAIYKFVPMSVSRRDVLTGTAMLSLGPRASGSRSAIVRMTPSAEQRRVIAGIPESDAYVTLHPDGESAVMVAVPFASPPMVRFSSDGRRCVVASATLGESQGTYLLSAFTTAGDTLFSREYTFPGTPIPDDSIEAILDGMLESRSGRPRYPAPIAAALRKEMRHRMPHIRPPISDVVLGRDSTTWLVMQAGDGRSSAVILGPRGEREATILFPGHFRLVQASRDVIWGLETDDDGLSSVVRYRVR